MKMLTLSDNFKKGFGRYVFGAERVGRTCFLNPSLDKKNFFAPSSNICKTNRVSTKPFYSKKRFRR